MSDDISVKILKKLYPNPLTANDDSGSFGSYCVGGALCKYAETVLNISLGNNLPKWFPSRSYLSSALQQLNTSLLRGQASTFASAIIDHNDNGRFDEAWKALEEAMEHQDHVSKTNELGDSQASQKVVS